jgi:alanine-synthesizing transaminase
LDKYASAKEAKNRGNFHRRGSDAPGILVRRKSGEPLLLRPKAYMFSRLVSRLHGETNQLYRLRDVQRSNGIAVCDLISGNVTENGIVYPQATLEGALVRASRSCTVYRPDSFGRMAAREAISGYYCERGSSIPPTHILLTPGTSISYWYCFKLLADEEDEILCPSPSYPLFDYIAAISGVKLVPYPLREGTRWSIDLDRLDGSVSTRTRAIVLISPHNPTGHVASPEEIQGLAEVARRHDLALISDEVFSEFLLRGTVLPRPAHSGAPLVITLNGFSKMFALPGIKLGWMAVSGDPGRVETALRALELVSDTFLPVNEVVQEAVPELMRAGRHFLAEYADQVCCRWRHTERILRTSGRCEFVPPEGGFYVTLHLHDLDEDGTAMELLRAEHILLHPGYFYEMKPHHLVLSFVHSPRVLEDVLPRLVGCLERLRGEGKPKPNEAG